MSCRARALPLPLVAIILRSGRAAPWGRRSRALQSLQFRLRAGRGAGYFALRGELLCPRRQSNQNAAGDVGKRKHEKFLPSEVFCAFMPPFPGPLLYGGVLLMRYACIRRASPGFAAPPSGPSALGRGSLDLSNRRPPAPEFPNCAAWFLTVQTFPQQSSG